MQPQIRYAEAPDGVRIAYSAVGSGPVLLIMPVMPGTHLERDWQLPGRAELYSRLARSFTVVRYDGRGAGLSQREVSDLSLAAHLGDLEAVLARLDCDHLSILARHIAGPIALSYAAEQPQRVGRLILWNSFSRVADFVNSRRSQALLPLLEQDWELFTETASYAGQGWPETERARQFAAYTRASISQTMYRAYISEFAKVDCSDLLPRVACPTLVFHRKDVAKIDLAVSEELVARLPNARLVLAEGMSTQLFGEDLAGVTETIESFLAEAAPAVSDGAPADAAWPAASFTRRELEILRLVSTGKHNREIAESLGVSVHTIDRHMANIFAKIGAHNRVEAAAFALTHRLD